MLAREDQAGLNKRPGKRVQKGERLLLRRRESGRRRTLSVPSHGVWQRVLASPHDEPHQLEVDWAVVTATRAAKVSWKHFMAGTGRTHKSEDAWGGRRVTAAIGTQ